MEGAASPELLAALLELNRLLNELDQIGCRANAVLIFIGNHATTPRSPLVPYALRLYCPKQSR